MREKKHSDEIFEIEDFLTHKECDDYLSRFEQEDFQEAEVNIGGEQVMIKNIRNNDRVLFFDHDLAIFLWNRIKEFVPNIIEDYQSSGLNEMFRVYKYSEGQRFKMHMDGTYKKSENEQSFYSFLIYLSEDFTGGETIFRKAGTIIPKKGNALVFRHKNRHEGKEVKSGIKYVLRTDIMYKKKL